MAPDRVSSMLAVFLENILIGISILVIYFYNEMNFLQFFLKHEAVLVSLVLYFLPFLQSLKHREMSPIVGGYQQSMENDGHCLPLLPCWH